MVKIVIDAGHGINTPGKRTPDGEREWTFNNKVALALIAKLNKYENVQILRVDDPTGKTDVPLKTRTDKANAFKGDVYVSCHHNAFQGKWGTHTGTDTFTYNHINANPKSVAIAKIVHPLVVKAMGLRDRGIKKENFHVLRETAMPAILIEGGFMDSSIDIKALRNDAKLKAQGEAIADGLVQYFKLKLKVVAPAPTPAPKPIETNNAIMGKSTATAEQMTAFVKTNNAKFDGRIAEAFMKVGAKYGVRGDIALCQSIIETGWFKFEGGTAVTPDQHNYCGMGVVSKGLKGNSFKSIDEGVTAQIQHLFAYASKNSLPAGESLVDPRFKYVTRGIAPTWQDLSGRWAMNPNYGNQIMQIFEQLMKTPVPKAPAPAPKPIEQTFHRVITGSFADRANAEAHVAKLKKAGFDSFIETFKK